jgi:hypothetical protein
MSTYPVERCQHIKVNGDRCGSPALRDRKSCHFNDRCSPVQVDVSTSATVPPAPFFLPVLEDAPSIRLAIAQICEHLLHRRLDAKKAGVLLYAMQVASSNLDRESNDRPSKDKSKDKSEDKSQDNCEEESAEAPSLPAGHQPPTTAT